MGTCAAANTEAAEVTACMFSGMKASAPVFARFIGLILLLLSAGKVHGSLARAGKVRGQTPKVPKQEKKKKPTGRAMKRIKYNRRFVNVGEWLQPLKSLAGFTLTHQHMCHCRCCCSFNDQHLHHAADAPP